MKGWGGIEDYRSGLCEKRGAVFMIGTRCMCVAMHQHAHTYSHALCSIELPYIAGSGPAYSLNPHARVRRPGIKATVDYYARVAIM